VSWEAVRGIPQGGSDDREVTSETSGGWNRQRTGNRVRGSLVSLQALYHVPRSQVWEGSRGRQAGKIHLHVDGRVVCGKRRGWYEREPMDGEERCPRCVERAERRGIAWPT